jgi:hypothetical protein
MKYEIETKASDQDVEFYGQDTVGYTAEAESLLSAVQGLEREFSGSFNRHDIVSVKSPQEVRDWQKEIA